MVIKITRRMTKRGRKFALATGISKKTKLDTLARKFSKNYHLSAFPSSSLKDNKLLLVSRNKPLKKSFTTYREWETGKRR